MSAQALIERGREFQIQDNGIGFTPPTMSEILGTQYQAEMTNWCPEGSPEEAKRRLGIT